MPCSKCNKSARVAPPNEKLQCVCCASLCHAACFDIAPNDVELVQSFKCNKCLLNRRNSIADDLAVGGGGSWSKSGNLSKTETSSSKVGMDHTGDLRSLSVPSSAQLPLLTASATSSAQLHNNNNLDILSSLNFVINKLNVISKENAALKNEVLEIRVENLELRNKLDNITELLSKQNEHYINKDQLTDLNKVLSEKFDSVHKQLAATPLVVLANGQSNKSELPTYASKARIPASDGSSPYVPNPSALGAHSSTELVTDSISDNVAPSAPTVVASSQSSLTWSSVTRNKTAVLKSNLKSIIGNNASTDLLTVTRFKWLHLSSFSNSETEEGIINFVQQSTGVPKSELKCHKLVKKDADLSKLSFVNFKLGVSSLYYNQVFTANVWPVSVQVREFHFLEQQRKPTVPSLLAQ